MTKYNIKEKIAQHYDAVSPYYYSLWGEHLHHGYWVTGTESKEEAQLALTKHLASVAKIRSGSSILDVGCGFGASSIYLSRNLNAETVGMTISAVQVSMAQAAAVKAGVDSRFMLMDAESMSLKKKFDVIWSVESISHYSDKKKFFSDAVSLLNPSGTVAFIDWFKKDGLTEADTKKFVTPIEKGMLVELMTMNDYVRELSALGLEVLNVENLNKQTARTWDITLDIIKNKIFWKLALKNGKEFVEFLRSFVALKKGFSSGNFVYGLIVARKK